jgi:glycosyltransferase involved in cell wall biosynthesis
LLKVCLLIPVYNHARALELFLPSLKPLGLDCLLVDDASAPESAALLDAMASREGSWLRLLRHGVNQGKGAAMMTGARAASELGYTHALQIDADGQHSAGDIPKFLEAAREHPQALICGRPVYDSSVPNSRRWGRLLSNLWIWINTLSFDIKDGMCGFRLYPLPPLIRLFSQVKVGRRMDFDTDVLVRLKWEGLKIVTLPVQVRYPLDGISHFLMGRDNWQISAMHTRLFFGMLARLPKLLKAKWLSGARSKN